MKKFFHVTVSIILIMVTGAGMIFAIDILVSRMSIELSEHESILIPEGKYSVFFEHREPATARSVSDEATKILLSRSNGGPVELHLNKDGSLYESSFGDMYAVSASYGVIEERGEYRISQGLPQDTELFLVNYLSRQYVFFGVFGAGMMFIIPLTIWMVYSLSQFAVLKKIFNVMAKISGVPTFR